MAYTSMEGTIMLRSTRHGMLASVREDLEWRDFLIEFQHLLQEHANALDHAQLVLDFGWRELEAPQFDSVIALLKQLGMSCGGILSTSLQTRTTAESRGYRAIIGRVGLAHHHGRRMRQEASTPAVAQKSIISESPVTSPPPQAAQADSPDSGLKDRDSQAEPPIQPDLSLELPAPGINSGLVIEPVPTSEPKPVESSPSQNQASQDQPISTGIFDSRDPAVASLPNISDSFEETPKPSSSSPHEPGIHQPQYQDEEPTLYLRKTLRSGQKVVFAGNVVLLGDLNPGAQIEADGDVIVLGQLRGSVHAGCEGDEEATVVTSSLKATQLRIADRFYHSESHNRFFRKTSSNGTLRARLDGETVVVEALPAR